MMFLFIGHFGHCVHEINRIGKIIELKRAFDVLLLQFPFRDFFEPRFQLIRFHQISHNGTTSNTPKIVLQRQNELLFLRRSSPASAAESRGPATLPEGESAGSFDDALLLSAPVRMTATCQESS